MRVLITGIDGFVGRHLARLIKSHGIEPFGIVYKKKPSEMFDVVDANCFDGDITDRNFLLDVLDNTQPTHIFHLAGILPGHAENYRPQYEINFFGSINLLEAVKIKNIDPWILMASSSAVYGRTEPHENPISETAELRPLTHYACSKIAQEMVAQKYHLSDGIRVISVRTFNLIGPGQPATLMASHFAQEIVSAERNGSGIVRVGDVAPRRDYVDVRDAVRAYWLLASCTNGKKGEVFNVCCGRSHSVQTCLDILVGLSRVPVQVMIDDSRKRKDEIPNQVGDQARLVAATGWMPRYDLATSLKDLLDYCRSSVIHEEEAGK